MARLHCNANPDLVIQLAAGSAASAPTRRITPSTTNGQGITHHAATGQPLNLPPRTKWRFGIGDPAPTATDWGRIGTPTLRFLPSRPLLHVFPLFAAASGVSPLPYGGRHRRSRCPEPCGCCEPV
jgi:hypothetical protein